MRVGLLGGTFDPPHEGHRHVSDRAAAALSLHKVIWLVSPQNPLKGRKPASLSDRIERARKVAGARTVVSGLEAGLGSPYTADTLRWLRRRFPGVRFFWLMGSDNLVNFHRWRRWKEIAREAEIVVVPRPGSTLRGRAAPAGRYLVQTGQVRFLDAPLNFASSTALREGARQ